MPKSICFLAPYFAALSAVLLISGCANKQLHSQDSSETEEIDGLLARGPSSEESYSDEDEEAFQLMFQSERPDEGLYVKFSQLEEVYYRAHVLTRKFDELLMQASESGEASQQDFLKLAIQEGVYPKIIALQQLGEETDSRLSYFVKRMLYISHDPATDAATKAKAEAALSYMSTYLAQSPYSLRLALSGCAQTLHEQHPDLPGFAKAYKRLFVNDYSALAEFSDQPKVKEHLEYLSVKLTSRPGYLRQRMEDIADTLTPDLLADLEGERSPQSVDDISVKKLPPGQFALIYEGPVRSAGNEVLLNALGARKTKAAFFIPTKLESQPLLRRLKSLGMVTGNGTFSRPQLPKTYNAEMVNELNESTNVIEAWTGSRPQVALLPFGAGRNSSRVRRVLGVTKLRVLSTQIPSFSWHDLNADRVANRVTRQMRMAKSGAVILNPSIVSAYVSAKLIDKKDRSTKFVDMNEVLK